MRGRQFLDMRFMHQRYRDSAWPFDAISGKRMNVTLKRAYEAPEPGDGFRILVDRLWPRGVTKRSARIDLWLKEIAPSAALRKWFAHDPSRWAEFHERYFRELNNNREMVEKLLEHLHRGPVTLVYSAKDKQHNNAVALKEYLSSSALKLRT